VQPFVALSGGESIAFFCTTMIFATDSWVLCGPHVIDKISHDELGSLGCVTFCYASPNRTSGAHIVSSSSLPQASSITSKNQPSFYTHTLHIIVHRQCIVWSRRRLFTTAPTTPIRGLLRNTSEKDQPRVKAILNFRLLVLSNRPRWH